MLLAVASALAAFGYRSETVAMASGGAARSVLVKSPAGRVRVPAPGAPEHEVAGPRKKGVVSIPTWTLAQHVLDLPYVFRCTVRLTFALLWTVFSMETQDSRWLSTAAGPEGMLGPHLRSRSCSVAVCSDARDSSVRLVEDCYLQPGPGCRHKDGLTQATDKMTQPSTHSSPAAQCIIIQENLSIGRHTSLPYHPLHSTRRPAIQTETVGVT